MPDTDFKNDHDILVTLVANMKELRTKQAENHAEIKDEIRELKDGFAQRLNTLESKVETIEVTKFPSADFVNYKNTHTIEVNQYITEFRNAIIDLRLWRAKILGAVAIISVIGTVLVELILRYFFKG